MMTKRIPIPLVAIFILFTLVLDIQSEAQVFQHADSAFSASSEHGKPLLLIFSGSDWCPNCRRLEKSVLNTPEFSNYLKENIILLTADFPQRKKQEAALKEQNEKLAEKYNPQGLFPTLVLFEPGGNKKSYIGYKNQTPDEFIDILNMNIQNFDRID